jgi:hypothetical protein
MISETSSPSSNIRTVELSETTTATASVRFDTEAAATWELVHDPCGLASTIRSAT